MTWWMRSAGNSGSRRSAIAARSTRMRPGLLIIVLGRGTKLSEKLMSDDKVYEGAIKFGETTNSYDADGELVASLPVPPLTLEQLNEAAAEFVGDLMQTPPMVSAVKIGRRAALQAGAERDRSAARAAPGARLQLPLQRLPGAAGRSSAWPARKEPTSAASRTSWDRSSAAARTWRRCGGWPPASSTWRRPSRWRRCSSSRRASWRSACCRS